MSFMGLLVLVAVYALGAWSWPWVSMKTGIGR